MKLGLTTTSRSVPPHVPARVPDVARPQGRHVAHESNEVVERNAESSDVRPTIDAARARALLLDEPQPLIAPESETALVRRKPQGASSRQTLTTEPQAAAPASETHPKVKPSAVARTTKGRRPSAK